MLLLGVMKNNKLIIAAAGSGKTTFLVNQALSINSEPVLITTFTEANEREIRERILSKKGYIPSNITIQTWFSFLLKHGVRPYQSLIGEEIHNETIGFYLLSEKSGRKKDRNGKALSSHQGHPLYWAERDFKKFYFTNSLKIYSDKISKFVYEANKASNDEVLNRISRLFTHIFIDEIQDLAGFDLELIKLLFKSKSSIVLVGDPRQVTYLTHHSKKYGKYADGQIKAFVENELGKKIECEIDEVTLAASHRNCQEICNYSAKLYPDLVKSLACNCDNCRKAIDHVGVFIVHSSDVDWYLDTYKPTQLRWNSTIKINTLHTVYNFGESKGATMDRVLIYPTKPMTDWIKNNNYELKNEGRAKFYVGLTRARYSSTIVLGYQDGDNFDGMIIIKPE